MYFINSTIFVEDGEGQTVGEVRQRFHVWQRNYDIYLGKQQVAVINSPLLAWEFAIKDAQGGVLALIDRNFQGFGKELFTDAGKYVIHFGDTPKVAAEQAANTVQAAHPDKPRPDVTALARIRTDVAVIPTSTGNQLEVVRPLSIDERTLILATAVSIDFDYFSQHSHGSGMLPFAMMPVPYPSGGGGGEAPANAPDGGATGEGASQQSPGESPPGNVGNLDDGEGDFSGEGFDGQSFEEPPQDFPSDDAGGGGEEGGWGDAGWTAGDEGAGEGGSALGTLWDIFRGDD